MSAATMGIIHAINKTITFIQSGWHALISRLQDFPQMGTT
jgi:hypothetical protein